jgi:hypothetical protein
MADTASIQLPENLVKPIVEAEIKAALIRQLSGQDALIREIVTRALTIKVDRDGKECGYGDTPLLNYLLHQSIRKMAKEAIEEWLAEKLPTIKGQLAAELAKRKGGLSQLIVAGLEETLKKQEWRLKVDCIFQDGSRS